jgi:hypothetical protein
LVEKLRPLLAILAVLAVPATAPASVRIVSAEAVGPVVAGQPAEVVVETSRPVDAARVTFPDLHGAFATTLCALRGRGSTRVVLPYRPAWAGTHSLLVSVSTGACGPWPDTDWRLIELEALPAPAPVASEAPPCANATAPPIPRTMRATRTAVVCLLNAERRARGLPALAADERLRRIASRSAHRAPRRSRRGEQRTVTPGTAPAAVVGAWLGNEGHRRDLLDPAVRRVGVAVLTRFPEPLRRPESTYVVELG